MRRIALLIAAILPCHGWAGDDARQLVPMPPEARAEMRAEMLDFQLALHQIIEALGGGKTGEAADTADRMIGVPAMGRHRSAPPQARPGMHMPSEMHLIARNMHFAASEFAKTARSGDTVKALSALTTVTGACVACHRSYRTQ